MGVRFEIDKSRGKIWGENWGQDLMKDFEAKIHGKKKYFVLFEEDRMRGNEAFCSSN